MGVAPEWSALLCSDLSAEITDVILNFRAPSTRCLYALKWKPFSFWCRQCDLDPIHCPVASILEFLQCRFSKGKAPATLKVDVAARYLLKEYGDLQALSISPSFMEFPPGLVKVLL